MKRHILRFALALASITAFSCSHSSRRDLDLSPEKQLPAGARPSYPESPRVPAQEVSELGSDAPSKESSDLDGSLDFSNYIRQYNIPQFLEQNDRAFLARLKLVDKAPAGAKIKVLTFTFDNGATTRRLAAHLCQAARRGAEVQFVADSKYGSIPGEKNLFDKPINEEIYQYMANCGVQIRIHNIVPTKFVGGVAIPGDLSSLFNRPEISPANRLNHRKLFWVKGPKDEDACFLLGGRNLGDHYLEWDGKKESYLDGDVLLCRHMFEGYLRENERDLIEQTEHSFNEIWNETEYSKSNFVPIFSKPDFEFRFITLDRQGARVKGRFVSLDSEEGQKARKSAGSGARVAKRDEAELALVKLSPSHHALAGLSKKRYEKYELEMIQEEGFSIPVAVPVGGGDAIIRGHSLKASWDWRLIRTDWEPPTGEARVPKNDQIRDELYRAIDREKKQIYIETGFGHVDEEFGKHLEAAMKRGVKVEMVSNSLFTYTGGEKLIRLLINPWVQDMIERYGVEKLLAKYGPDGKERAYSEARFILRLTSIQAGHVIHFKAAGFKCQERVNERGEKYFDKHFILGSHNFHPRSGLSDKEHALSWSEPVDYECIEAVGEKHFDPKFVAEERREQELARAGDMSLAMEDQDLIDIRTRFYKKVGARYAKAGTPILQNTTSLYQEMKRALSDTQAKEKMGTFEYFFAKGMVRFVLTEDPKPGDPRLKGPFQKMINILGPLGKRLEKFM